ncbi:MAG: arylesterase [Alphaproteobacteria bacterium]|nr:arylesterase [Alphaproteobacteria bacterium]
MSDFSSDGVARTASRPYGPAGRDFNVSRPLIRLFCLIALFLLPHAAAAKEPVILALGDSLVAGYGLTDGEAFPAQLETALAKQGIRARVINGGVSGDTTAGGLQRVDWLMSDKPDLVIVELGANDGLRGIDPAETQRNLDGILTRMNEVGVRVLLAGMLAPPNLGREYGDEFNAIFPALAKKHKVALYPFFLDGVVADPELNLSDGLHPNAKGVSVIVQRILPHVVKQLGAVE